MALRHTHFYIGSHIRIILIDGRQLSGKYIRTGRRGIETREHNPVPLAKIRAVSYDKVHGR